ncbi:MAG TPA: phage head closure protein [Sphingobium sp.]|nr:phage head closure protein [Sphingobium sp.]
MTQVIALRLNRRVTILQREEGRDPTYNTPTGEWVPLATVWAEVTDMLPSRGERIVEGVDIARRPARVRMRYRTDVDMTMRLTVDGRAMRIVAGPVELGRRDGIELLCEGLTTEGQEP